MAASYVTQIIYIDHGFISNSTVIVLDMFSN